MGGQGGVRGGAIDGGGAGGAASSSLLSLPLRKAGKLADLSFISICSRVSRSSFLLPSVSLSVPPGNSGWGGGWIPQSTWLGYWLKGEVEPNGIPSAPPCCPLLPASGGMPALSPGVLLTVSWVLNVLFFCWLPGLQTPGEAKSLRHQNQF